MKRLPQAALALVLVMLPAAAAAPAGGELQDTRAFEASFATSFYQFDACGDPLAGRIYRRALAEKFASCPFTADARRTLRQREGAQARMSSATIRSLIEETGGLPTHVAGMPGTCREHRESADYVALRARLDAYDAKTIEASSLISAPCDADRIEPQ